MSTRPPSSRVGVRPLAALLRGVASAAVASLLAACPTTPPASPPAPPSEATKESRPSENEAASRSPAAREASSERATPSSAAKARSSESESPSEEAAKAALGAPESSPDGRSGATGAGSAGDVLSEEERRQGLDDELTRSLSRFDERLARERAEVDEKAAAAARALAERERDRDAGGSRERGAAGVGGYGRPAPPSGAETAAVPGGGDPVGGDQQDLPHDRPDDVGAGEDDDIVARQLREAAEKETDPALREKLWEEYREYKRSSS